MANSFAFKVSAAVLLGLFNIHLEILARCAALRTSCRHLWDEDKFELRPRCVLAGIARMDWQIHLSVFFSTFIYCEGYSAVAVSGSFESRNDRRTIERHSSFQWHEHDKKKRSATRQHT